MQFLFSIKLAAEQATENAQTHGIDLTDVGCRGQPVAQLAQQHTTGHRNDKQHNHVDDIVGSTRTYRLVDETATEPYHQQTETNLHNTCHDAHRRIPANAARLLP